MPPRSWLLTGNAGTNAQTEFVGTVDNQPLSIATAGTQRVVVDTAGNVGINAPSPHSALEVAQSGESAVTVTNAGGGPVAVDFNTSPPSSAGTYNPSSRIAALAGGNFTDDIAFLGNAAGAQNNGLAERMRITSEGVGIGTEAPVARLDVRGQACCQGVLSINNAAGLGVGSPGDSRAAVTFGATDTPAAFYLGAYTSDTLPNTLLGLYSYQIQRWLQLWTPDGNISVTGDILLTGADCAEEFDVSAEALPSPGTVVVIDEGGAVRESRRAYDTAVAGVVSGAGAYRHALVLDKQASGRRRVPVALVGKVHCKVDATYSPVKLGDLLTTSPTPGHAMKATDKEKAFGSILGKALGAITDGCALVPVLVALQ